MKKPKTSKFLKYLILALILFALISSLSFAFYWFLATPQPKSIEKALFRGISYTRDVRNSPRPVIIHIVSVDLKEDGIKIFITPGYPKSDLPLSAQTTSKFLSKYNLQLAVNGDGFTPWHSYTILDYYPHTGDPVDVIGFAASKGNVYSNDTDDEPTLYISLSNQARINTQIGKIYNAISGNEQIVKNGKITTNSDTSPQPRTAIALDRANRHLLIFVVDGRQPNYSEGVTLKELAQIIIDYGGYNAMNMDGGGSSTLVMESKIGLPHLLNRPINHHIPGNQRPVGNHIGIYAKSLDN